MALAPTVAAFWRRAVAERWGDVAALGVTWRLGKGEFVRNEGVGVGRLGAWKC